MSVTAQSGGAGWANPRPASSWAGVPASTEDSGITQASPQADGGARRLVPPAQVLGRRSAAGGPPAHTGSPGLTQAKRDFHWQTREIGLTWGPGFTELSSPVTC